MGGGLVDGSKSQFKYCLQFGPVSKILLDEWMDGWMGAKAILRIAYSIKKLGQVPTKRLTF